MCEGPGRSARAANAPDGFAPGLSAVLRAAANCAPPKAFKATPLHHAVVASPGEDDDALECIEDTEETSARDARESSDDLRSRVARALRDRARETGAGRVTTSAATSPPSGHAAAPRRLPFGYGGDARRRRVDARARPGPGGAFNVVRALPPSARTRTRGTGPARRPCFSPRRGVTARRRSTSSTPARSWRRKTPSGSRRPTSPRSRGARERSTRCWSAAERSARPGRTRSGTATGGRRCTPPRARTGRTSPPS